ncbi:hypothetical protein [Pseudonocardia lacus]|uniref:hypothetical protein n=1 Tax=Pseudonocardia lacus TaxID=2835865 RepID=UPI001BDBF814|nr:hypothetical protein [Pseudonocardia lacus]
MTVADIDDAMGWEAGTARRRRWRDRDRGGLPFADAELGGVALWFRATIEEWRESTADPHDEPAEDGPDDDGPVDVDDVPVEADADKPAEEPEPEPEPADEPAAVEPEPEPPVLVSGYDLAPGERVLVEVRGRWHEAHVRHRDRTTVAVDYTLDGTPSGMRRQRVGLDRIRVPDA